MTNTRVDISFEINDVRPPTDFRGTTFSNYKKTDVRTQMIENMKNGKIEPACYWCAELVCAGQYMDIWEIILHYVGKHIHFGNPKLVIYLERRFSIFRNIVSQSILTNELQLRNYDNIRKLYAELVCVLTLSPRKHSFEPVKINRVEEFDITLMTERLKAPSVEYAKNVFRPKDPQEVYIAVNEFAYHISRDSRNVMSACYWIEWIIEFDIICKNRKQPCRCDEKRNRYGIEPKFMRDIIWLVWDCILEYTEKIENAFVGSIMKSLLGLFCIKYTSGSSKKRRFLLYYAVALLIEDISTTTEIIQEENKPILQNVTNQINQIYKQIKRNECSPKMDYLYSNLDDKNKVAEQSVKKMEIVNSILGL